MLSLTELRRLAAWYRQLAERTESPIIWEARLLMAQDLENEAVRLADQISTTDEPLQEYN